MSTTLIDPVLTAPASPEVCTVGISNVCTCMWCPACGHGVGDLDECDGCGGDTEYFDCEGYCYRDAVDALDEVVKQWVALNPSVDNEWRIDGKGMGWRGLSGHTTVDLTRNSASEAISVDSEWTQKWTIEVAPGGALTATQSHHDAMGETYTVTARI